MYSKFDKVIVTTNNFHKDKIGTIVEVFPAGFMDNEIVYTISYDNSNNRGMFKESELAII
jgi:hypothetical protein